MSKLEVSSFKVFVNHLKTFGIFGLIILFLLPLLFCIVATARKTFLRKIPTGWSLGKGKWFLYLQCF